ncbi:MAG: hypothetical protein QM783_14720 [Phycisphaerales bacterium]
MRKQNMKGEVDEARRASASLHTAALEFVDALITLERLRSKIVEYSDNELGADIVDVEARRKYVERKQLELRALSGPRWADALERIEHAKSKLVESHTVLMTSAPGILLTNTYNSVLVKLNGCYAAHQGMAPEFLDDVDDPAERLKMINKAVGEYIETKQLVKEWLLQQADHLRKSRDSAWYRLRHRRSAFKRLYSVEDELL